MRKGFRALVAGLAVSLLASLPAVSQQVYSMNEVAGMVDSGRVPDVGSYVDVNGVFMYVVHSVTEDAYSQVVVTVREGHEYLMMTVTDRQDVISATSSLEEYISFFSLPPLFDGKIPVYFVHPFVPGEYYGTRVGDYQFNVRWGETDVPGVWLVMVDGLGDWGEHPDTTLYLADKVTPWYKPYKGN